jgi:hypothetical protein
VNALPLEKLELEAEVFKSSGTYLSVWVNPEEHNNHSHHYDSSNLKNSKLITTTYYSKTLMFNDKEVNSLSLNI